MNYDLARYYFRHYEIEYPIKFIDLERIVFLSYQYDKGISPVVYKKKKSLFLSGDVAQSSPLLSSDILGGGHLAKHSLLLFYAWTKKLFCKFNDLLSIKSILNKKPK